jgi:two-component sensor histidine kinase
MVNLSQADAVDDLKRAIEGRIQALANVHSLFVASRWIGAGLTTIASQELAPYSKTGDMRVRIRGPEVLFEPNTAQALAVTLHELATNAAKYGSLSVSNGQVELNWSHQSDGRLKLRWTEVGGPPVRAPTRTGFGGRLIGQVIGQLRGDSSFYWRVDGLVCETASGCELVDKETRHGQRCASPVTLTWNQVLAKLSWLTMKPVSNVTSMWISQKLKTTPCIVAQQQRR